MLTIVLTGGCVVVVRTESVLDAPPAVVWDRLLRVATLLEVAWPLLVMRVPEDAPERWQLDRTVPVTSRLLGVLPLGTQRVRFVEIDHDARRAVTTESGGLVRRWDHVLTVVGPDRGPATYVDHVTIDAGPVTGLVAWFARRLYRHRHRRWRRLAPLLH